MTEDLFNGGALPEVETGAAELPDASGDDVAIDAGSSDSDDGSYIEDLSRAFEKHAESDAPDDPRADLQREFEAHREAETKAAADQDWSSKFDTMYRETLAAHGLSPEQAAQMGVTREAAVERLFTAERYLKSDPAAGMAWLAQNYGAQLDQTQRAQMAASVLRSLGFEHASQLGEAERRELEEARQSFRAIRQHIAEAQQAQQQQVAHAEQTAAAHIAEFRRTHPDMDSVSRLMGSLIMSGEAHDLPSAYRLARQMRGASANGGTDAFAAQKQAVAKARAARTPNTPSRSHAPADEDEDLPQTEMLRRALRQSANARGNGWRI